MRTACTLHVCVVHFLPHSHPLHSFYPQRRRLGEDYFKHNTGGAYDFRRDEGERCGAGCSQVAWEANGSYSTVLFATEAVRVIANQTTGRPHTPLFMWLAFQGVHCPTESPPEYAAPYAGIIKDPLRQQYAGMLAAVDEGVRNVSAALAELRAAGGRDVFVVVSMYTAHRFLVVLAK